MKRISIAMAGFLIGWFSSLPVLAERAYPVHLEETETNQMLVGDVAEIETGPLDKNIEDLRCEIKGDAIVLAVKQGDASSGYICRFRAVKSGDAVVVEKRPRFGKKEKSNTEGKKFRIRVIAINKIPKVSITDIAADPWKYEKSFVRLSGVSRGWGGPVTATTVWGTMSRRSDQVFEDKSGAAYIYGIPRSEWGKPLELIAKVVSPKLLEWELMAYKILDKKRRDDPVKGVIEGNNRFALDLYKRLAQKEGNLFFSPFSISDALAMTYAGARGKTEKQMAEVLHFSLAQDKFHPAFSKLVKSIEEEAKNRFYELRIANALWGQKDYGFLSSFKGLIDRYYGGDFYTVDFIHKTEKARKRINYWVGKKTEEKIQELLQQGDIDRQTRLVLTNAIYFKGKWASQFQKSDTIPMPFHSAFIKTVRVPMMYQKGIFGYYRTRNGKLQILELPYQGKELSMVIFLPADQEVMKRFENWLSVERLETLLKKLRKREVVVYLPRFTLKSRYYLKKLLAAMGMPEAFTNRADFSGMTGRKDLKISKAVHQAYVKVNEEGTEATAATAVVMHTKSMSRYPVFRADRPFVFVIFHKKSGAVLFIGRVVSPIGDEQ